MALLGGLVVVDCPDLWCNQSVNLVDQLLKQPPDRVALHVGDHAVTYGELKQRVQNWSRELRGRFEPHSRIAVLSGNDADFVTAYLATLHAGCVCVPLNPASPGPELIREMVSVQPSALVVGPAGGASLAGIRDHLQANGVQIYGPDGNELDDVDEPAELDTPAQEVDAEDPALLLFTSGTAGSPKAAILTHGNLISSLQSVLSTPADLTSEHHTALAVIPLFHVMGLNIVVNLGLRIGATLILEDHAYPERTAALLAEHGVTMIAGPPTLWNALAALDSLSGVDQIRVALSGAAPLDPRTSTILRDRHGIEIREGYGLTETCGTVASGVAEVNVPNGSVGRPMPGVECRLVDSSGEDVYVGDVGEVWVRGPMVSPGYWEDEAATAASRTSDGWLRTGDLAVVDDQGCLAIVNRMKDLVIVSGFNVHPAEVEQILEMHPAVASAGVAGEADPRTGERVVAYVVLAAGATADADELREHCMGELARYKVPKRIELVDALPVGLVGKLRRQDLGQAVS